MRFGKTVCGRDAAAELTWMYSQRVLPNRTRQLQLPDKVSQLRWLSFRGNQIELCVAPGKMGEEYVKDSDVAFTVVGSVGEDTSDEDTKRIAADMLAGGVGLLIMVGGDGTARDVHDAVGLDIPVVAVPAGVKVFSSVFAFSTRAAAEMVDAFVEGADVTEEEVLDIDEDAFREGRLDSTLYGYLSVPNVKALLQGGKEASAGGSTAESKECHEALCRSRGLSLPESLPWRYKGMPRRH